MGPYIIESVFMNYLILVYEQGYRSNKKNLPNIINQEKSDSVEILKTFNMLLDTLEPYFIWEFLTKNFDIIVNQQDDKESITNGATMEQICGIIHMLLNMPTLESSIDIQSKYLAEMLYRLLKTLNNSIEKLTSNQITLSIELLLKILKSIIPNDTNHHLFNHRQRIFENSWTDSDTDDELHSNILQNPSLITEQQDLNDIEDLLHQMVHKVEKQLLSKTSYERKLRSSTKTMLESNSHLEKAIKLYKIFFHRFIQTNLIDKHQILINDKFQSIYSIIQHKTDDNLSIVFNRYQQLKEFQIKFNDNIDQYKTSFEDCCKLLIEFCCFPRQAPTNDSTIVSKGTEILNM